MPDAETNSDSYFELFDLVFGLLKTNALSGMRNKFLELPEKILDELSS